MSDIEGIPQVLQYKYLGIYLDEKLNFEYHINYLKEKTFKRAKSLKWLM
jgi:hypothetical protein